MADVAVVSVIASAAVGLGGIIVGAWNGREERELRRQERMSNNAAARELRVGERRAEIYVELLINLERDLFTFEAISPTTLRPYGPPPLSDEDWIAWKARVAAFGSEDVLELFREIGRVAERLAKAWDACEKLDNAGERPGAAFDEQFAIIEAARQQLRLKTLPALERRVSKELTGVIQP